MKKRRLLLVVVVLASALISFRAIRPNDNYYEITRNIDIFATLFKEVNAFYVDDVDPEALVEVGIDAMLNSLDPYTNYISEKELESFRAMTTGEYGGIGAMVMNFDQQFYIGLAYDGFPASNSGLSGGDKIVSVEGVVLKGKTTAQVSQLLKGKPGTEVNLEVVKNGKEVSEPVVIKRANIELKNVTYAKKIEPNIGYIVLSDFTTGAGKEVSNAVKELKKEGVSKIILDVRGNPGGLLHEAINVANVFIPRNTEIVATKGKVKSWNKNYKSLNKAVDIEIPLVVLVDGQSASASEIVSGVIQDYDRGVLIGQNTFGKGLVQTTRPLKYKAKLKVTSAKYYIPSGRCIQAIDYANKEEEVAHEAFQTKNGREVWSGNGLKPDISLTPPTASPLLEQMLLKGIVFKYAAYYKATHGAIPNAYDFTLTEKEYTEFVNWVESESFTYASNLDRSFDAFKTEVSALAIGATLETDIENLEQKIKANRALEINQDRALIQLALESEIAKHYYKTQGAIESNLEEDQYIAEAIRVLNDQSEYSRILKSK